MQYQDLLSKSLMGNSVQDWIIAVAALIGTYIALCIFRNVVVAKIKNMAKTTSISADDALVDVFGNISGLFVVAASIFVSASLLNLPRSADKIVYVLFVLVAVYEVIGVLERVILFLISRFWAKNNDEAEREHMSHILRVVVRVLLWLVGVVLILSNLGINVTSLVASLGIGGIAIALAVQNILGDLFSSFSIYLDKPFKIGDFIVVGDHMGTVKSIGLKTTRIQALRGEEIVIPNAELTSERVRNFKQMKKRRIPFVIGVTYDTPKSKLERIPDIVAEIVNGTENAELDRVHFKEFADSSLNFEIVFYTLTGDYGAYMDARQEINLAIVEKFAEEGIAFAFPTRTVHLSNAA